MVLSSLSLLSQLRTLNHFCPDHDEYSNCSIAILMGGTSFLAKCWKEWTSLNSLSLKAQRAERSQGRLQLATVES